MKRNSLDYIEDINDAISKIEIFTKGMDYQDFVEDDKTIYAIVRALEIIGEAAKKIPPDIKNSYPQIPWKDVVGMRDKLIHEYFGVNTKVLWNTIKQDIPSLKPLVQTFLSTLKEKKPLG